MAGSQAFHLLSQRFSPSQCLLLVFSGSALCLSAPLLTHSYEKTLLAFCGFEALLGIYWPAIALLRASALDATQRSSTMAVFRVLLNLLVISVLPIAGSLPEAYVFALAIAMLLVCYACTHMVDDEGAEADDPSSRALSQHGYAHVEPRELVALDELSRADDERRDGGAAGPLTGRLPPELRLRGAGLAPARERSRVSGALRSAWSYLSMAAPSDPSPGYAALSCSPASHGRDDGETGERARLAPSHEGASPRHRDPA